MVTPVHLTEYLCWTFCTKSNFLSGNRLQGCGKRLPDPFLNTLIHPLHTLLLQLMMGHPTLLGLTSHHQPPSPTTETPGPASDSHCGIWALRVSMETELCRPVWEMGLMSQNGNKGLGISAETRLGKIRDRIDTEEK
ncbi:hypothetical protein LR48_Vigan744s000200 [Vigna angularis]|uniref:Uncharacterized protein n=1 Tax=Phaseolus angularis TaxID=3914 RepID=A0A0L9TGW3_PHAAN|nr:hypothetical protein LR48_Vigan744s000200 [Vigna angularis]